ncbi:hypothetical protein [Catelliglobosispora koreensis]|uniref:hypothetical protein n=1 Tax=Catelliglobosispora koreensis TaxID=129052 RepID=UPI0012FB8FAB|nr:hypothetical protein [Catelliglobosispora koreensis]
MDSKRVGSRETPNTVTEKYPMREKSDVSRLGDEEGKVPNVRPSPWSLLRLRLAVVTSMCGAAEALIHIGVKPVTAALAVCSLAAATVMAGCRLFPESVIGRPPVSGVVIAVVIIALRADVLSLLTLGVILYVGWARQSGPIAPTPRAAEA